MSYRYNALKQSYDKDLEEFNKKKLIQFLIEKKRRKKGLQYILSDLSYQNHRF